MENSDILKLLEKQRDDLFNKLNITSISKLHKQQYDGIKSGEIYLIVDEKEEMLEELKELSKDTSYNKPFKNKLKEYLNLDNKKIVSHFYEELKSVFEEMVVSDKFDDIQGIFIEYDFYYHYSSCIQCYGKQDYPTYQEPRYIKEIDYNKQVLFIQKGINFEPAWLDCEEFEELEHLEVSTELENLFQLHSRVLLHKAIDNLHNNKILKTFSVKPTFIYINEHDCEQMILYITP